MSGQVVAVGLTTVDVVHEMSTPIVLGRKAMCDRVELLAGGPAANACVTAAAMLGSATLISALGSDSRADIADLDLSMHGVRLLDCAPMSGWTMPVASCIVDAAGERTVISPGARGSNFDLDETARQAVANADVLLLDGHHPSLAEQALAARKPDCIVILDGGSVKTRAEQWLPQVTVLAASRDYAVVSLGGDERDALAHGLAGGCEAVVITRGADPILYQFAGRESVSEQPVRRVEVRSTLGAGDAFHGALAAGLAGAIRPGHRLDLERLLPAAIELAAEVATVRVQSWGGREWLSLLSRWTLPGG